MQRGGSAQEGAPSPALPSVGGCPVRQCGIAAVTQPAVSSPHQFPRAVVGHELAPRTGAARFMPQTRGAFCSGSKSFRHTSRSLRRGRKRLR